LRIQYMQTLILDQFLHRIHIMLYAAKAMSLNWTPAQILAPATVLANMKERE
jgi:hypothetical protein